jgi:hypothetical protein
MRGFSTLEIMISFAIMSLVFAGVMLADFSSTYWVIASQTSSEGLYKSKTRIEELRAASKKDFYSVVSSSPTKDVDATCAQGGLCYFVESIVTDISTCSKYIEAVSSWRVEGYPTTTTSLPTHLTNPAEAIAQGGDCLLNPPKGAWTGVTASSTATIAGTPSGVDVLGGYAYVGSDAAPYLSAWRGSGLSYTNSFKVSDPVNGLDVARDEATGRTYAFLALASTTAQMAVVDVTDPLAPVELTRMDLSNVAASGSFPQGWRVLYYNQRLYVTTRETTGPEFHVFDVGNPGVPNELGSFEINTSVYDMVVRDEKVAGAIKRFAYLATTKGSAGKVIVLDVTNPASISELTGAATALPANAKSISLSGHTLFVGTDSSSDKELLAYDASDVMGASAGFPRIAAAEIGSAVIGLKALGGFVFALTSTQSAPLISTLLDIDGNTAYLAKNTAKELQIFTPALSLLKKQSVGSNTLQLYESN